MHAGGPSRSRTQLNAMYLSSVRPGGRGAIVGPAAGCAPGLILRYPGHRIAIVLEALGILQRVLAGVHHQVPVVVALLRGMHGVEGYRDVLLAGAEEAADADDQSGGL